MVDQFVGYLLGALDPEETLRIEQTIAADGTARRHLDLLRLALLPLDGVCQHVDAPMGLAGRTCQKIRQLRLYT